MMTRYNYYDNYLNVKFHYAIDKSVRKIHDLKLIKLKFIAQSDYQFSY